MKSPAPSPDPAAEALTARFYSELHDLAHRMFASERKDHTLQPTALVHEACLRLLSTSPLPDLPRSDRLALAARVLRQVLVDHHRKHEADKRGGNSMRVELDPEISTTPDTWIEFETIHGALERLRELHERQAEVVSLRVFGGLEMADIADALGVSKRTAEADWTVARAWLRRELSGLSPGTSAPGIFA